MKPLLTIDQFEASARRSIQAKETFIENLQAVIAAQEIQLGKWASSPDSAAFGEILQAEIELSARKAVAERTRLAFRSDAELQALLNAPQGKEILTGFLELKRKVVAGLKAKIAPLRKSALESEEAGSDEHFELNDRADDIAAAVADYQGVLLGVEQALKNFPKQIDGTVNYVAIRDRLHAIQS